MYFKIPSFLYLLQVIILVLFPINRIHIELGFRLVPIYMLMPLVVVILVLLSSKKIEKLLVFEVIFLFFFVFALTTSIYSFFPEESFRFILGLGIVSFTYIICRLFIQCRLNYLASAFATAARIFIVLSFANYLLGLLQMNILMEHTDFYGVTIEKTVPRMIGVNNDPNICAFAHLLFFFYFVFEKKASSKYFATIALVAIILTLSRGGFLALLIGLMSCLLIFKSNSKTKVILGSFFLLFIILGTMSLNYEIIEPFLDKRLKGLESGGGRFEIWLNALDMFHNRPFTGYGIFTFKNVSMMLYNNPRHAHNTYLEILAETGIFGLTLFFCFMFTLVIFSFRIAKAYERCKFLFPSVIAVCVAVASLSMYINLTFWYLLLIIVVFSINEKRIEIRNSYIYHLHKAQSGRGTCGKNVL